jgi:hypothetical protein
MSTSTHRKTSWDVGRKWTRKDVIVEPHEHGNKTQLNMTGDGK